MSTALRLFLFDRLAEGADVRRFPHKPFRGLLGDNGHNNHLSVQKPIDGVFRLTQRESSMALKRLIQLYFL